MRRLARGQARGFRVSRILYILACGAPPARDVGILAGLAQQRGWDVCVVTSACGRTFVDPAALEAMTGHSVRSEYKNLGEPEVLALDLARTSHEPQSRPLHAALIAAARCDAYAARDVLAHRQAQVLHDCSAPRPPCPCRGRSRPRRSCVEESWNSRNRRVDRREASLPECPEDVTAVANCRTRAGRRCGPGSPSAASRRG